MLQKSYNEFVNPKQLNSQTKIILIYQNKAKYKEIVILNKCFQINKNIHKEKMIDIIHN